MGIAGDSANNILWRLLHGEMPAGFEPKIWWVSLGMNDLTRMQCSEEVVVLGVLRVVEEILKRRPKTRVVINSLLPMADLRGGPAVSQKDYRDAFSTYHGKRSSVTASHYVRTHVGNKETIVKKPTDDGGRRALSSSTMTKVNNRRLLEKALESYMKNQNDNSDEIRQLQQNLEVELGETHGIDNYGEVAQAHMERELSDHKRDRYNPTMDQDRHHQKKYQFFRKRRMPLWTSIYAINQQLFKFCEKHDKVDFFDATNIFAERKTTESGSHRFYTLKSDLISARGHPTELGYLQWEDEIVKQALYILENMKKESPELFVNTAEGSNVGGDANSSGGEDEEPPAGDTAGDDTDVNMETGNGGAEEGTKEEGQVGEATANPSSDTTTAVGPPQEGDVTKGYSGGNSTSVTGYGMQPQPPAAGQQGAGYPQPGMQQSPSGYQQPGMQQQQGGYGSNYGQNPPQQQYGAGGNAMGYQQQPGPGQYYQGQPQGGQPGFGAYQGGSAGGYQGQQAGMQGNYAPGISGGYGQGQQQPQGGNYAGNSYQQPAQGGAGYGSYQGPQQQGQTVQGTPPYQQPQGAGGQQRPFGYYQEQEVQKQLEQQMSGGQAGSSAYQQPQAPGSYQASPQDGMQGPQQDEGTNPMSAEQGPDNAALGDDETPRAGDGNQGTVPESDDSMAAADDDQT